MIIQIGTETDESRILWKRKESDEWERTDIDDLIEAYENRQKEQKPGDLISRQALIDEVLDDGNGAVLSYPAGMYEDDLVERIEKQMIQHFIGVIEYVSQVESKPVCEDAISREWVLNEIITKVEDDNSLTDEQKGSLSVAKYIIRHAPPVEPKRPKGEWIYITNPIGEKICVCSECEHIKQQGYGEYCGHCGAKMGGDDNETYK